MAIKMITSSNFSSRMKEAFKAGLTEAGWPAYAVDFEEVNGQYDDGDGEGSSKRDLYDAFDKADRDQGGTYEVIVAAGGLVSAHAAQKMIGHKPFLVLVGQLPKFPLDTQSRFFGGVNFDMVGQNIARHDFLVGHYKISPDKVCLIWNKNSKMGKNEQKEWKRRGWPDEPVNVNSEADVIQAIGAAAGKRYQGLVLSGDPYFTAHMNAVVSKVNSTNMVACYPFSAYAFATPAPSKPGSMIYGPDLEFAYRLIGRKAGLVLDHASDPPDTGLDLCPATGPIYMGG
jgi:hypothetical protein